MSASHKAHRQWEPRRGGAMLELALCAPILLYVLLGVTDFARYYTEASQVRAAAMAAARRQAAASDPTALGSGGAQAGELVIELETFCECPFEPDVRFMCGERSCGGYGEPARYSQATVEQPFSFIGAYPGFPREFPIRRKAGVRIR